jgi:hypothetical protein
MQILRVAHVNRHRQPNIRNVLRGQQFRLAQFRPLRIAEVFDLPQIGQLHNQKKKISLIPSCSPARNHRRQ